MLLSTPGFFFFHKLGNPIGYIINLMGVSI